MEGAEILDSTDIILNALMERFRGPLVGLFAAWGTGWRDAEELAQDVFVEAYFSFSRFRGNPDDSKQTGAWLRGIARNLYYDYLRRRTKDRKREEIDSELVDPSASSTPPELSPVLLAMEKLPEKFRIVLYLHYLEDTPVRVVAGLLDLTERAVESRLFRARKALHERLVREGWQPSPSEAKS